MASCNFTLPTLDNALAVWSQRLLAVVLPTIFYFSMNYMAPPPDTNYVAPPPAGQTVRTNIMELKASPAEAMGAVLDAADDAIGTCAICREDYTRPVRTPCDHVYCNMCIRTALSNQDRCPLCQRALFKSVEDEEGNLEARTVYWLCISAMLQLLLLVWRTPTEQAGLMLFMLLKASLVLSALGFLYFLDGFFLICGVYGPHLRRRMMAGATAFMLALNCIVWQADPRAFDTIVRAVVLCTTFPWVLRIAVIAIRDLHRGGWKWKVVHQWFH